MNIILTDDQAAKVRGCLTDLPYAYLFRPSCQAGAVTVCRCLDCATERASEAFAILDGAQRVEVVGEVVKENDYWSRGHFYEGGRPDVSITRLSERKIGTPLYAVKETK